MSEKMLAALMNSEHADCEHPLPVHVGSVSLRYDDHDGAAGVEHDARHAARNGPNVSLSGNQK